MGTIGGRPTFGRTSSAAVFTAGRLAVASVSGRREDVAGLGAAAAFAGFGVSANEGITAGGAALAWRTASAFASRAISLAAASFAEREAASFMAVSFCSSVSSGAGR